MEIRHNILELQMRVDCKARATVIADVHTVLKYMLKQCVMRQHNKKWAHKQTAKNCAVYSIIHNHCSIQASEHIHDW